MTSEISKDSGRAPYLRTLASSVADCWLKLPEISARPPGIAELTDGAEITSPSSTMANWFSGRLPAGQGAGDALERRATGAVELEVDDPLDLVLRDAGGGGGQLGALDQRRDRAGTSRSAPCCRRPAAGRRRRGRPLRVARERCEGRLVGLASAASRWPCREACPDPASRAGACSESAGRWAAAVRVGGRRSGWRSLGLALGAPADGSVVGCRGTRRRGLRGRGRRAGSPPRRRTRLGSAAPPSGRPGGRARPAGRSAR